MAWLNSWEHPKCNDGLMLSFDYWKTIKVFWPQQLDDHFSGQIKEYNYKYNDGPILVFWQL